MTFDDNEKENSMQLIDSKYWWIFSIPGADSPEAGKVSRWTIPHTEITIARVEKGSQQGDYLFSPETVDRLKAYYTKVKALPYRPDAIIGKIGPAGRWNFQAFNQNVNMQIMQEFNKA